MHSQCIQKRSRRLNRQLDEGLGARIDGRRADYGTEFDIDDLIYMDTATRTKAAARSDRGRARWPRTKPRAKYFGLSSVKGGDTPCMQQAKLFAGGARRARQKQSARRRSDADADARPAPALDEPVAVAGVDPGGGARSRIRKDWGVSMRSDSFSQGGPARIAIVAWTIRRTRRCIRTAVSGLAPVVGRLRRSALPDDPLRPDRRARSPRARPGPTGGPGVDGLGFDDATVSATAERTMRIAWARGDAGRNARTFPVMLYRGVRPGTRYERRDVVTWAGSLWHATNATTSARPGDRAPV